ncbi:hypothetical protein CBFG_03424 [Clostridiales bacterium 1_7_47FAA]|nr:hypothetical protein CBFG_03424 [Clostridiales bacterium 1_7_47FAA]
MRGEVRRREEKRKEKMRAIIDKQGDSGYNGSMNTGKRRGFV